MWFRKPVKPKPWDVPQVLTVLHQPLTLNPKPLNKPRASRFDSLCGGRKRGSGGSIDSMAQTLNPEP